MVKTIDYRGPDDEGYYLTGFDNFQVGMGFRRLAILDLSQKGHQPMFFKDLVITLNGEIYNFKEIRTDLQKHGYLFESYSDTEVVIKAFHFWGIKMLERFIGMFALAVFNIKTHEFYLIRDRMGIKPLYYFTPGNDLVYGSELKPIMTYPYFRKELSFTSLSKYLYHGYIAGTDSIFKNVYKLEPGSYIKFSNGKTEIIKYWDLSELYIQNRSEKITGEEECFTRLDDIITSSVRYRMISDVPVGSFLSGGIDSSLITAVMQKISDQPVNTFTIGFNEDSFNEAVNAKKISKYLGTKHCELYLPIEKVKELIEEIPRFYDEPFGDSSALPTILVSRLAKNNVKVVLSGDGGDELFCGYKNYESAQKMSRYMAFGKLLNIFPGQSDIGRLLFRINHRCGRYPYLNSHVNIININYILSKYFLSNIFLKREYVIDRKYFDLENITDNVQELYMLNDMLTYLPGDILTKVDRASMSVSLEARVPLLDHRLVEFSFKVPHYLKYNNGIKKYLLKALAYKYIPKELLDRPKQGFAIPVFEWLKSDLHYLIDNYMAKDFLMKQGIFNHLSTDHFLRQLKSPQNTGLIGNYIWNILMFQLWYKRYME